MNDQLALFDCAQCESCGGGYEPADDDGGDNYHQFCPDCFDMHCVP